MRTALDTNIISALWSGEASKDELVKLLTRSRREGGLVVCGAVYAELMAYPSTSRNALDRFLSESDIQKDFVTGRDVWLEAGRAYAEYAQRRRASAGGLAKRLLVDFVVGAHALYEADRLLTLDSERYRHAFPSLVLLS
ncbi:type II toxin-antitoxin system VapC family toxin [soil metagenome]